MMLREAWQHSVRQQLVEMIAEEDPKRKVKPKDVNFGFHFPFEYVTQVCQILELSSFMCWPEQGGLNKQDANLVADIKTWFRLVRRLRFEYEQGEWRGPERETAERNDNPLNRRG